MKRNTLYLCAALCFCVVVSVGTMQPFARPCKHYTISSTASDYYINLDGHAHLVEFENDTGGDTVGTQGEVSTCMGDDSVSGLYTTKPFNWDYDDDGADDGNILNGIEWPLQQRRVVVAAECLYFNTTAYSQPGILSLCPVKYLTR